MKKSNPIEIFHRINKLKVKAGIPLNADETGYIDPSAINNAQKAIDAGETHYRSQIEAVLIKLDSTWKDLPAAPKNHLKKNLNILYNYANNAKDLAQTYHYDLMEHFAASLRDFCEKLDIAKKPHHIIVQAHIDVMWTTFYQNIKDEGGPAAQELKTIVATAISRYT